MAKTPYVGSVRDETEAVDRTVNRTAEYYRTADQADDLKEAETDKKRKKETEEVRGLCNSCNNLRWIKTRLAVRDKYWCARPEMTRALNGSIMEMGDEITSCPWYSPKLERGQMGLREMFSKAVLIQAKDYDPGNKEHDEEHGILYL